MHSWHQPFYGGLTSGFTYFINGLIDQLSNDKHQFVTFIEIKLINSGVIEISNYPRLIVKKSILSGNQFDCSKKSMIYSGVCFFEGMNYSLGDDSFEIPY